MTETESAGSLTSQFGWTKAAEEPRSKATVSTNGVATGLGVVGVLLLLSAAVWGAVRPTNLSLSIGSWQNTVLLAAIVAGVVLLGGSWLLARGQRNRIAKLQLKNEEALKAELRVLRVEFTSRRRAEQDTRTERAGFETQIAELTQATEALRAELDRRRMTERNLSQQQQELVRSKGVLQLHVQARTQELEKLQRRSELILNSAGDGICGLDLAGKINFANPAAARVLGLSVEELIGLLEPEVFAGFRANAVGGAPAEIVAARRDGSTFVAEFVRSPLTENGRTIGEVMLFKDVTARKQAEEALVVKAAELARSNAELEQFAFVASHDLQEPLRKIQAFGDRLKTKCDEAKLEAGRDYLERMQSAAARMRRLIDDLLTFSRVISRTEPFSAVNLNTTVKEVLSDLEVCVEKNAARIDVGELPTVEADAMQMRQLLQNLISNALKFQPPGGTPVVSIRGRIVSLAMVSGQTAFHARPPTETGSAGDAAFCELVVQDNGIGFEEQYLDKIFAVFQRLHGRQEYEGTGVGLAVCRRIVDRHRGKITAQSKPGEGASFIVLLPVRPRPTGDNPA